MQYIKTITTIIQQQHYHFGQSILTLRRQKQARIAQKIKHALSPTYLSVTDTTVGSNSCGQMYKIVVESTKFQGKGRVQQHQMVSNSIEDELAEIHGFNLKTKLPSNSKKIDQIPEDQDE